MKKRWVVLALLFIPLLPAAMIAPMVAQVDAWGLQTHHFIAIEAMGQMSNQSWAQAFQYYTPEILEGSTTPDTAWQDWENHLYYPYNGNNTAPQAAQRWYGFARDNFTLGNWEDGFFAAGVMSHYASDPHIPAHTSTWWAGHTGYEHDINDQLGTLTLGVPEEHEVTNVSQLVVDAATLAYTYYDYIVDAYPTSETVAIETNVTVKAITEECLTLAINNTLSLFYTMTLGINAPDVTITYDSVAVLDVAHNNDYVYDDALNAINQTLAREGYELIIWEDEINSTALSGADLLIATCALDAYSSSELTAISDWVAVGNKSILLTGRGDFDTYTDNARPNQILAEIGSHIRVNDDNVYMQGTYQPWYNDLTEILAPGETVGLTEDVNSITLFSPASLYFTDDDPVLPILYADVTAYQTDQQSPDISVIYDDLDDEEFGNQIPLAAAEEIGTLRILVTGTTFFSDFDYGKTEFDNVQFLENFLEWAGNRSIGEIDMVDEIAPRVGTAEWTPILPDSGDNVTFTVEITDPSGVASAQLVLISNAGQQTIALTGVSDTYTAEIPGFIDETVSIKVEAVDNEGNNATRAYFRIVWGQGSTTSTTTTSTNGGGSLPISLELAIAMTAGIAAVVVIAAVYIKRR